MFEFLYGYVELKIRPPLLIRKRIKTLFSYKYQYWIHLEYVKIGPYRDLNEVTFGYYMACKGYGNV